MNKKNQGHGICGSKNIYSSKVHVDNWVEDTIGMKLATEPRHGQVLYQTVTTASFTPPTERPDLPPLPANIPSTLELKTKNKEGMPYAILFEHNLKPSEAEERFRSNAMLTNYARPDLMSSQQFVSTESNTLSRKKAKEMIDDINRSFVKTTEYRAANAHLKWSPVNTTVAVEKTTPLPDFRRRNPLSSSFTPGI